MNPPNLNLCTPSSKVSHAFLQLQEILRIGPTISYGLWHVRISLTAAKMTNSTYVEVVYIYQCMYHPCGL